MVGRVSRRRLRFPSAIAARAVIPAMAGIRTADAVGSAGVPPAESRQPRG